MSHHDGESYTFGNFPAKYKFVIGQSNQESIWSYALLEIYDHPHKILRDYRSNAIPVLPSLEGAVSSLEEWPNLMGQQFPMHVAFLAIALLLFLAFRGRAEKQDLHSILKKLRLQCILYNCGVLCCPSIYNMHHSLVGRGAYAYTPVTRAF